MLLRMSFFNSLMLLSMFLFVAAPVHGFDSRKLDESTVPAPTEEKCAPCNPSPPPPSPPPPVLCPPPPPPPELPPPTPKKPPSGYCPPPPPAPSFIYVTGPPGNLYPIDTDFSAAGRPTVGLQVLIGCGILLGSLFVRFGV
ncbi:PREDICTED: formin-like protein 20 [Populus euphratica]|uniref:Formin-like protein 20 n=1 Tax=Populus euphratica TaxID=75702 RepID=A0AAJ6V148_POPEU|nr:PREDICTED: formin-like protein 20 [Populus euphratica]